jgi:hypothetical protein
MNRDPEVDRWLDEAHHPLNQTLRRARDVILAADERVTESIRCKTPTFAHEGNIASLNASKNVVSIMFHRGSEIPGDHRRPRGRGQARAHHAVQVAQASARCGPQPSSHAHSIGSRPRPTDRRSVGAR